MPRRRGVLRCLRRRWAAAPRRPRLPPAVKQRAPHAGKQGPPPPKLRKGGCRRGAGGAEQPCHLRCAVPCCARCEQVKEILSAYRIGRLQGGADPALKAVDPYKDEPTRWALCSTCSIRSTVPAVPVLQYIPYLIYIPILRYLLCSIPLAPCKSGSGWAPGLCEPAPVQYGQPHWPLLHQLQAFCTGTQLLRCGTCRGRCRHPALVVRSAKPMNAETPRELLAAGLITPTELFYVSTLRTESVISGLQQRGPWKRSCKTDSRAVRRPTAERAAPASRRPAASSGAKLPPLLARDRCLTAPARPPARLPACPAPRCATTCRCLWVWTRRRTGCGWRGRVCARCGQRRIFPRSLIPSFPRTVPFLLAAAAAAAASPRLTAYLSLYPALVA